MSDHATELRHLAQQRWAVVYEHDLFFRSCADEIDALRAEVKRLRGLLREAADEPDVCISPGWKRIFNAFLARREESTPLAPESKLWLWRNGDHFLAFEYLYPCFTPGGDPMTLGEPVGYAVFKRSFDRDAARGEL